MFLRADDCLCSVWVSRENAGQKGVINLPVIACEIHVIFLIHRLKFGVETAYYGILEAVALNLQPVLHLVRWNVLGVAGYIG